MTTPSLTLLGPGNGFTAGDLDTSGYIAVIPAFQKIYFADGRPYSATIADSGYHKLDFLNTRINAKVNPAWTKGTVITQAHTTGDPTEAIVDEIVQRGSDYWILAYRTNPIEFTTDHDIVPASGSTLVLANINSITAPPHWLNWSPSPNGYSVTGGTLPDGGSNIGCLCFGRIFLNSMRNPHQWSCSRIFDPLDWDTASTDVGAPTMSQNAKAGEVGNPLVAEIPYKDFYLIWGCANEMWILQSDPLMGGVNRCLSKATGIFSPTSYCWDDKNNLYFLGTDGIYSLSSDAIINAQPPVNITKERIPKLITSLGLNRRTDRVVMGYDKQRYGVQVSITQQDGQWAVGFWIDLRTGGVFPDTFPALQCQSSLFYYDSYKTTERGLLLGGYDGYIRKYDETTKNDEGSNAIDSWVTFGPFTSAGNDARSKVGINEISLTLGDESDGINVDVYSAKSADLLADNILDEQTPALSKVITGDSLKNSIVDRVSGVSTAVKMSNDTIDQSWSIEETNIILSGEGRQKG